VAIALGKYKLERRLAIGGMAEIFLATHVGPEGFKRTVAIKKILDHLLVDRDFVTMFLDEARLVARFSHPNLVQIFDLHESEESYYLAMEYVHGASMDQVTWAAGEKRIPLPLDYAVKIVSQACEGLDYAHNYRDADGTQLNLIHRDVSPQNIMLSYDGLVKLLDFGIAKAASNIYKTRAGIIKGKASFMSPEQVAGKKDLDRRADIFSLGVVLYDFVTGARPFSGENEADILRAIVNAEAEDPLKHNPDLPKELVEILGRALQKDREQRYETAREMRGDLERFLFGRQVLVDSHALGNFLREVLSPEEMAAGYLRSTPSGRSRALEGDEVPPTMLTPRPITSPSSTHTPEDSGPKSDPTRKKPSQPVVDSPPGSDPTRKKQSLPVNGSRPRTDPTVRMPSSPETAAPKDLFDRALSSSEPRKRDAGVKVEPVESVRAAEPSQPAEPEQQMLGPLPRRVVLGLAGAAAALLVVLVGILIASGDGEQERGAPPPGAPAAVVDDAEPARPAAEPAVAVDDPTGSDTVARTASGTADKGATDTLAEVEPEPAAEDEPAAEAEVAEDARESGRKIPSVLERLKASQSSRKKRAAARTPRPRRRPQKAKRATAAKTAASVKTKGRLLVFSKPWTHVFVDGKTRGSTPVEDPIELTPGVHVLELKNKGLGIRYHEKVTIDKDKERSFRKTFGKGRLQVFVKPFGDVIVDGKQRGLTPLESPIELYEGSHRIKVTCSRTGKKHTRDVVIEAGETNTVKIDLR